MLGSNAVVALVVAIAWSFSYQEHFVRHYYHAQSVAAAVSG